MSLTELMLVVGLWAIWMGVLLMLLHGLGTTARADERRFPRRAGGDPACS